MKCGESTLYIGLQENEKGLGQKYFSPSEKRPINQHV
jgi:hypothetical protein